MNKNLITGIVVTSSAIGMGLIGWFGRKLSKLTKKVGMAVDDMAKTEAKDIQQELIERSVEKAAKQEVRKYAEQASNEALQSVKSEVKMQVRKSVDEAFDDLKKSVEDEIADQVANIDHHALQKDIVDKAKKKILEKFDGSLDDVLKDFQDDLNRVKKIHTSISDILMDRDNDKGLRIRLG